MPELNGELLAAVINIIIIDLVLSGDNAVVIGMAAARLAGRDRRLAIIWGVVGAIGLRVAFTATFAMLVNIPLLQLVGGLMLVWIAVKLLKPHDESGVNIKAASNRFEAIRTIVMADVVMSLDNILAVGGAAHGELGLLLFGLALSMPLITFGSSFVARALDSMPWLMYVGAGVLGRVAGEMIAHDPYTHRAIEMVPGLSFLEQPAGPFTSIPGFSSVTWLQLLLEVGLVVAILAIGYFRRRTDPTPSTIREDAHLEAEGAREVAEEVTNTLQGRTDETPRTR